jgi:hypothetical protein
MLGAELGAIRRGLLRTAVVDRGRENLPFRRVCLSGPCRIGSPCLVKLDAYAVVGEPDVRIGDRDCSASSGNNLSCSVPAIPVGQVATITVTWHLGGDFSP